PHARGDVRAHGLRQTLNRSVTESTSCGTPSDGSSVVGSALQVNRSRGNLMQGARRMALLAVLAGACGPAAFIVGSASNRAPPAKGGPCRLGNHDGQIKHLIYLQFDNTHFRRDNPNVPSDLEQMPHLLNFLKGNGTLLTNDHTILISHT